MISVGPVGLVFELFTLSSEHSRDDTPWWLFWPCCQVKGHNWNVCLVVARVGGGGGGTRNRDESFGLRPGSKAGFGDLEKCPVFFVLAMGLLERNGRGELSADHSPHLWLCILFPFLPGSFFLFLLSLLSSSHLFWEEEQGSDTLRGLPCVIIRLAPG